MKLMLALIFCGPLALSTFARADDQGLDAAIRDAVGGRITAYVGSDVGGHNSAIEGGAVGAATEVAVTANGHRYRPGRGPYHAAPPTSKPHWKAPSHD